MQPNDQTVVEESLFRLCLPGQWHGSYDGRSGVWQYRSAEGGEAVTVGILRRNSGPALESIKADFRAYLQARRKSELGLGGEKLRLGEPRIREDPDAVLASYSGFDPEANRRTFTSVIVNPIAAASFYYEAIGYTAETFAARAKIVLEKVGLIGK